MDRIIGVVIGLIHRGRVSTLQSIFFFLINLLNTLDLFPYHGCSTLWTASMGHPIISQRSHCHGHCLARDKIWTGLL